jgi:hypothetical protein
VIVTIAAVSGFLSGKGGKICDIGIPWWALSRRVDRALRPSSHCSSRMVVSLCVRDPWCPARDWALEVAGLSGTRCFRRPGAAGSVELQGQPWRAWAASPWAAGACHLGGVSDRCAVASRIFSQSWRTIYLFTLLGRLCLTLPNFKNFAYSAKLALLTLFRLEHDLAAEDNTRGHHVVPKW